MRGEGKVPFSLDTHLTEGKYRPVGADKGWQQLACAVEFAQPWSKDRKIISPETRARTRRSKIKHRIISERGSSGDVCKPGHNEGS